MSTENKETISFRLPTNYRSALDMLATTVDRNRSELIVDAIRSYLDVQQWQINEIRAALVEADNGDFESPENVEKVFKKLTR